MSTYLVVTSLPHKCLLLMTAQILTAIVLMLLYQGLMAIRGSLFTTTPVSYASQILHTTFVVCSIYRYNAFVVNGVRGLFVLEVAAVVAIFISSRPLAHSNGHCIGPSTMQSPTQRFLFTYVNFSYTSCDLLVNECTKNSLPPLIHDSTLFLLTWVKFQTSLRYGWGRVPAVKNFVQDGIWAYALPSGE